MSANDQGVVVTDNAAKSRFEITLDGQLAGFAQYRRRPERIVFTHTEILPEFERKGLGRQLAKAALEAERAAGMRVTPQCPFIAEYIRRNPEYADLVDPANPH